MFTRVSINFGDRYPHATREEAVAAGKRAGFEFSVYKDGEVTPLLSWSPINGFTYY